MLKRLLNFVVGEEHHGQPLLQVFFLRFASALANMCSGCKSDCQKKVYSDVLKWMVCLIRAKCYAMQANFNSEMSHRQRHGRCIAVASDRLFA